MTSTQQTVAVLHQGAPPPAVGGVVKPMKPGGYQDSGADIAYNLRAAGTAVVTPSESPDPASDAGWTFPDTKEGIRAAVDAGATLLWANTTLYASHPLVELRDELAQRGVSFVGQDPRDTERFEDKEWCNRWLAAQEGLEDAFPKAWLVAKDKPEQLTEVTLPAVVKPVRGRGSHGVSLVKTAEELQQRTAELFKEGDLVLIEAFCSGEEITVTMMPPGEYDTVGSKSSHWAFPLVTRFNHIDGIAPYNGVVAVTANSRAVTPAEFEADPAYQLAARQCERIAALCKAYAPMRVDARRVSDTDRRFKLFDVNSKPNATGPGRPGREEQASLTLIAAQQLGWSYQDLLRQTLRAAKSVNPRTPPMQAVSSALQAASRPSRAAAVTARTLAAAALSQPARSDRSPSSSLSPPPPSPGEDTKDPDVKPPAGRDQSVSPPPEEEKPAKKKRARKPKEPVVYVIPDVERKTTTWNGRLGYACLNTILRKQKPPVFCSRTCRIDTIKKEDKGMPYLKELGRQNMEDLTKLIEWNAAHHIYFMRMSSEMFPFAAHPDYQYSLEYAEKELKMAGETANRLGVRLTTHPGQFTQLGSPRRVVVENAYRDLEYHNEMMDRMGLGKDSVMIIHGGGVYGDKDAAIKRFKENYKELSQGVKNRLVLENDEICYNVDDLLPICEELNIPLVFDYHHDWIYPSSQTPAELMPRILATWHRKNIKPKFHLSEPRRGAETVMEKRAHADRCQSLPEPLPEEADLMIEAKDKEQAVFHLFRIYDLHPTIHEDLRPPAEEETKQTARTAGKKKKDKKGATSASADEGTTDGTEGTLGAGETDGTLPSSPVSAARELEAEPQGLQELHAAKEGLMPLPEGVDAEGQEYCPPTKVKGETVDPAHKSLAKANGKGKGKKRASAGGDEEEEKKPVKKARKTKAKTSDGDEAEVKPKAKRQSKKKVAAAKEEEEKVGGLEEVAMEVAKE
ncbi:hypothetical protein JCM10207_001684 [Rhodosporidiobolus poonsookiae]